MDQRSLVGFSWWSRFGSFFCEALLRSFVGACVNQSDVSQRSDRIRYVGSVTRGKLAY
jgi:hypothetical protein